MFKRMPIGFWSVAVAIFFPQFVLSQRQFDTSRIPSTEVTFSSVVGSGARAFGMGGAFMATADDATAASWNPAGLAQLEKPELSLVISANGFDRNLPPRSAIVINEDGDNISFEDELFSRSGKNLDFLSFTFPWRTGKTKLVPQISFQRVINFALNDEFAAPLKSRAEVFYPDLNQPLPDVFNITQLREGEFSGGYDVISASLGVRLSSAVSLGAAFNYWFNGTKGTVTNDYAFQAAIYQDMDGDSVYDDLTIESATTIEKDEIEIDVSGLNVNFGALIKPHPKINLGFVFRTPFTLDFEETRQRFSDGELDPAESFTQSAKIKYPYSVGLGVAIRPADQLTLSTDFTLANWSEARRTDGVVTFLEDAAPQTIAEEPFPGNGTDDDSNPRKQNDTKQLRIGAEYVFLKDKWLLPVRAGFFRNTQFITDGNDDSITYTGLTAGIGIGIKDFLFDVAFVRQSGDTVVRNSTGGDLQFSSNQFYFSAIYRLPW